MALKQEEGDLSQGMGVASRSQKRQEVDPTLEPLERKAVLLTALIQLFYKTKILHFKCVEINCVFHLLFCVYRYVFCVCIIIFKIIIMRSYILLNYILIPSRLYFYKIQVSILLQFFFFLSHLDSQCFQHYILHNPPSLE